MRKIYSKCRINLSLFIGDLLEIYWRFIGDLLEIATAVAV